MKEARKLIKEIHKPECAAYKKMKKMKKQATELQSKHAKEKDRYLDKMGVSKT